MRGVSNGLAQLATLQPIVFSLRPAAALALVQEQRDNLLFPQLEERFGRQLGQGQEPVVGQKLAFADQRMNVNE